MKKLAILLAACLLFTGCGKDVPSNPTDKSGASSTAPFNGIETKQAVFERVGEFTYPIDYVMTGSPGGYNIRDSIYYSLYLTNKLSVPAKTMEDFSEYVATISKVTLREYKKVFAEEKELDGHKAFYVEGYGKDSNKFKYVVFMGILTDNGMTICNAVINEEDWETKGMVCKDIMNSFKHNGMVDPETLKEAARPKTLKPAFTIPATWKLVKDESNTKYYKNSTNSIEFTMYFGKQDNASLDNIMANNAVTWKVEDKEIQGFKGRVARGEFTPEIPESSSEASSSSKPSKPSSKNSSSSVPEGPIVPKGSLEYYDYEVTQDGYRCIVVLITKLDTATVEERAEAEEVIQMIKLYQQEETLSDDSSSSTAPAADPIPEESESSEGAETSEPVEENAETASHPGDTESATAGKDNDVVLS